uniref:Uncharacterized protein n=1 Tax=Anguilla anguilla TaxID=7936 RepID=A0A0E9WGL3_ANGAN
MQEKAAGTCASVSCVNMGIQIWITVECETKHSSNAFPTLSTRGQHENNFLKA